MRVVLKLVMLIVGLVCITGACFLIVDNMDKDITGKVESDRILAELSQEEDQILPNVQMSENKIPSVKVQDDYIMGTVEYDSTKLPVFSEYSENNMLSAPCRYSGSQEEGNLIIAGHNYVSHFGTLFNLSVGDSVYFTDVYDTKTTYTVSAIETLKGTDVSGIQEGDWDMTLFTCTLDGGHRLVIRLKSVK